MGPQNLSTLEAALSDLHRKEFDVLWDAMRSSSSTELVPSGGLPSNPAVASEIVQIALIESQGAVAVALAKAGIPIPGSALERAKLLETITSLEIVQKKMPADLRLHTAEVDAKVAQAEAAQASAVTDGEKVLARREHDVSAEAHRAIAAKNEAQWQLEQQGGQHALKRVVNEVAAETKLVDLNGQRVKNESSLAIQRNEAEFINAHADVDRTKRQAALVKADSQAKTQLRKETRTARKRERREDRKDGWDAILGGVLPARDPDRNGRSNGK